MLNFGSRRRLCVVWWLTLCASVVETVCLLLTAMAPKAAKPAKGAGQEAKAAAKRASRPASGAAASLDKEAADRTRRDMSNMVTQLKNSKDPAKVQALALYQSYSRLAPEKATMLQKWLQDKSCKWVNSYMQEVLVETSSTSTMVEGHGTMCLACHNMHMQSQYFCSPPEAL